MQTVLAVSSDLLEEIDLNPTDEVSEIAQNVAALLNTPKGSVPLMREMGLPMKFRDLPQNIAVKRLEMEMTTALDAYEPRAEMQAATAFFAEDGKAQITLEVTLNGG
jgi:hypothetical protein